MAEAGITIGPLLNLARQEVVAVARLADGGGGAGLDLHARAGERQHCALDAGLVHGAEPQLAEVTQRRQHMAIDRRVHVADRGLPVVLEAGAQEVLFQGDLADHPILFFHSRFLYRNLV